MIRHWSVKNVIKYAWFYRLSPSWKLLLATNKPELRLKVTAHAHFTHDVRASRENELNSHKLGNNCNKRREIECFFVLIIDLLINFYIMTAGILSICGRFFKQFVFVVCNCSSIWNIYFKYDHNAPVIDQSTWCEKGRGGGGVCLQIDRLI